MVKQIHLGIELPLLASLLTRYAREIEQIDEVSSLSINKLELHLEEELAIFDCTLYRKELN